jgi:hypothetical protein
MPLAAMDIDSQKARQVFSYMYRRGYSTSKDKEGPGQPLRGALGSPLCPQLMMARTYPKAQARRLNTELNRKGNSRMCV